MPKINPKILIWARETAGYSLEEASRKVSIGPAYGMSSSQRLHAYEQGEIEPSRSLLNRMAKQYRRPLLVFYLKEPPKTADLGQDFRVLPEGYQQKEEALVSALLRDVKVRQSIIKSAMVDEEDEKELDFIDSVDKDEDPGLITEKINRLLALDIVEFYNKSSKSDAFNFLRAKVESLGVFVLLIGDLGSHHTSLDTSVFRGFALSDKIAPFIVINDNDSYAAWSFTLVHEFTHLLLGHTGVSNSYADTQIEILCNTVASRVLLPEGKLPELTFLGKETFEGLIDAIYQFADEKNLSNSMVAYRLFKDGIIDTNEWLKLRNHFTSMWKEFKDKKRTKGDSGPNYYTIRKHRLGKNLIATVQSMAFEGVLTTDKASMVLGVNPANMHNLFEERLPLIKGQ